MPSFSNLLQTVNLLEETNLLLQTNLLQQTNLLMPPFAPTTFSISGTISGPGGPGATVNLTGTATQSTTADISGNYLFSGLLNGPYTITPSNAGYIFAPTSQNETISGASITGVNFTSTAVPTLGVFAASSGGTHNVPLAVAVGDYVVVFTNTSASSITVTDNGGNTYTQVIYQIIGAGEQYAHVCESATATASLITANNGSVGACMSAGTIKQATGVGNTSTNFGNSGALTTSVTTSANNSIVVGCLVGSNVTVTSGTLQAFTIATFDSFNYVGILTTIVPTSGTNTTFAGTQASNYWQALAVEIK